MVDRGVAQGFENGLPDGVSATENGEAIGGDLWIVECGERAIVAIEVGSANGAESSSPRDNTGTMDRDAASGPKEQENIASRLDDGGRILPSVGDVRRVPRSKIGWGARLDHNLAWLAKTLSHRSRGRTGIKIIKNVGKDKA